MTARAIQKYHLHTVLSAQCSVLPPVHQHGNHLDTDFQDRDQAADGSQRKPPHLRRPGRVLQQCCQQDAQQLMCNRENEINQTKRYKCHLHTGQAEFLRKTQLQIVDIEILRQIMAMRKKHFSRNWKSVCGCMILSCQASWLQCNHCGKNISSNIVVNG